MEIHFQTTDHVVAVEKVAEQHIRTKYCKCNSFRVISHIIILAKIAITHSKVGQSSPNPKNIEEQKNSLGLVIYQKCVTVVVSEKHTHMVQIMISLRRAGREIIKEEREEIRRWRRGMRRGRRKVESWRRGQRRGQRRVQKRGYRIQRKD